MNTLIRQAHKLLILLMALLPTRKEIINQEEKEINETYFLPEESCTTLTHSEVGDAWSSQIPNKQSK